MKESGRISAYEFQKLIARIFYYPPVLDTGLSVSFPDVPSEDTGRLLLVRNSGKRSRGLRHLPELKFDSRHTPPPPKKNYEIIKTKHNIIGNHINIHTDKYLMRAKENRRKICTCLIAILF